MLHGTTHSDDFKRNTGLQCWNDVAAIQNNVETILQRCVALKLLTRRWYGWSPGKLCSDAYDTLAPLITSKVTPLILLISKDELTGRVMEELRKKDRDSLISEIRELRKSAVVKPLVDQVI